ncbi:MAG: ECF transporter S component [Oscillospiraceae bacterium]
MLPEFKPVVAMTILAGVAFGGETGFLVGAMTMLVSNMLFSQGQWTPWQMFAMGIIGWLAGVLYRKGVLRRSRISLCIFGVIASTIIYGGIMNPASALLWSNTINWKIILSYYVTGIPIDLVRAMATFVFLWLGAEPMLEKPRPGQDQIWLSGVSSESFSWFQEEDFVLFFFSICRVERC